ncbi:MAG: radical SAM family heme chaperone HemW [Spirochaetales bacterium]|nr:radical SAM family heme chaperone HemW [Spirochaetales bacterium]
MKAIPLYLHIPFCRSKCSYCNFYSLPLKDERTEKIFIEELIRQIDFQMNLTGSGSLKTVYIGGGTPSGLSGKGMDRLLSFLNTKCTEETEEFSVECNPEDISEELIGLFNDSPVNRISLGVQSFNSNVLRESGRRTTGEQTEKALEIIGNHWKGRLNIDIITGLPGQTSQGQLHDMEKAVGTGADHISCYSLIVDEDSAIAGHPLLPDGEEEDIQWNLSRGFLLEQGFENYEVSNFARPGFESRHNLQYWRMNEYLGCGPGAVAMFKDHSIGRISNPSDLTLWLKGERELWNETLEEISPAEFLFENFMMGLRTSEGIDRKEFHRRFSYYPEYLIRRTIESSSSEYFQIDEKALSLNSKARLFMNPLLLKIRDEIEESDFDFKVHWP